jgi:D-alanyl-lipoteichoic acid acyltransferase DltB (MBOAT superfamily)
MDLSRLLMSLTHILFFTLVSVLISTVRSGRLRSTLLFCFSVFALYSLQPALSLRAFDFWLPTTAIVLAIWIWIATQDHNSQLTKENLRSLGLLAASLTIVIISSYLPKEYRYFVSLPVNLIDGFGSLIFIAIVAWGIWRIKRLNRQIDIVLILLIIGIFLGLKAPNITREIARAARQVTGQSPDLASALDLNWLGFSYIAFRLLHVLRDYQNGRLPLMGFRAFLLYVLFFPALSAGPIDRVERFLKDLLDDKEISVWVQLRFGGSRIVRGLFKKFVLADSLSLIALNATHIEFVQTRFWLWILLYLYSFRIYFDFSGYTDIAIGIGSLSGIQLPENFKQPYLQSDIGAFWNRWHITLAQWFRAYVFNPLTRSMRQRSIAKSPWLIILIGQLVTMILIGLWHGITWNFFVWGLWHALGLFIHNRWMEYQRGRQLPNSRGTVITRTRTALSWLLTFNFVSVGWVWFSSPDMQTAWSAFVKLMGGSLG